jgi:hypothetical protein
MGTFNKFSTLVAAPIVALGLSVAAPAKAVPVDAEILLLMDVSGSVNSTEFNLQRTGYANAFHSAAVHSAIASTTNGVAVRLVQWSGATQQAESIAWTHIFDVASSNAVGAAIAAMSRSFSGSTAIGAAINNTFASIGDEVDVSGDGTTNDGIASVTGRNNALAAGVDVINGLVIGGSSGVLSHYQSDVIGGTNGNGSPAFALTASTFSDFETAITNKLSAEITGTGIPEPGMIAIFGLGLAGLAYTRRRKAA